MRSHHSTAFSVQCRLLPARRSRKEGSMPRDLRRLPERVMMQVIACGMAALTASIPPVAMGSNPKTPDPQKAVAVQQQAAPTIDVTVRRIELQSLLGDRAQLIAELEVMP